MTSVGNGKLVFLSLIFQLIQGGTYLALNARERQRTSRNAPTVHVRRNVLEKEKKDGTLGFFKNDLDDLLKK